MTREREVAEERPRAAAWAERATVPERRRPVGRRLVGSVVGFVALATLAGIVAFRSSPTARLAATLPSVEARLLRLGVPTSPAAIVPNVAPERDATVAMTDLSSSGKALYQSVAWPPDPGRLLDRGLLEAKLIATVDGMAGRTDFAVARPYESGLDQVEPYIGGWNAVANLLRRDVHAAIDSGDPSRTRVALTRLDRFGTLLQKDPVPLSWRVGLGLRTHATQAAAKALENSKNAGFRGAISDWRDARPTEVSPARAYLALAALTRFSLSTPRRATSPTGFLERPRLPLIGRATTLDAWRASALEPFANFLEGLEASEEPKERDRLLTDFLRGSELARTEWERVRYREVKGLAAAFEKEMRQARDARAALDRALGK